jgi:hypothetical protein
MPTVLIDGPYSFVFFSSDRGEPPHIHVKREPLAVGVVVTDSFISVGLDDARQLTVPIAWYPRLARATNEERQNWQLLGGGYAIGWPDLDEHIGIEGLLAGRRSGESDASFQRWLKARARPTRAATKSKKKKDTG